MEFCKVPDWFDVSVGWRVFESGWRRCLTCRWLSGVRRSGRRSGDQELDRFRDDGKGSCLDVCRIDKETVTSWYPIMEEYKAGLCVLIQFIASPSHSPTHFSPRNMATIRGVWLVSSATNHVAMFCWYKIVICFGEKYKLFFTRLYEKALNISP